jgi:hypothetical protein
VRAIAVVELAGVADCDAVNVADCPGLRLMLRTLVVVTPCTTPLAFVQVRFAPLTRVKLPPATMPDPLALLIACAILVSLTGIVNPLAYAISPEPGTTLPTHVEPRE